MKLKYAVKLGFPAQKLYQVPAMVRVEVEKSPYKKIIVCLMFPSDYPNVVILKSKTLAPKLLDGWTITSNNGS